MKTKGTFVVLAFFSLMLLVLPMTGACVSKKPKVNGTKWTCKQEIFVADAGTMTMKKTIHFVDNKNVKIITISSMPSHPASYVGPDGKVPMIKGHTSESVESGTYKVKGNKIILDVEGERTKVMYTKDSLLVEKEGIFTKD